MLQWLMQKVVGLKPEQGAWPIIYCCLAPTEDLESAFHTEQPGDVRLSCG